MEEGMHVMASGKFMAVNMGSWGSEKMSWEEQLYGRPKEHWPLSLDPSPALRRCLVSSGTPRSSLHRSSPQEHSATASETLEMDTGNGCECRGVEWSYTVCLRLSPTLENRKRPDLGEWLNVGIMCIIHLLALPILVVAHVAHWVAIFCHNHKVKLN